MIQMNGKAKKNKIKERFPVDEIIFNPKIRDLQDGQTIVDKQGRVGRITDFDPTGKQMFNNAQGFHAVCANFGGNYDDCLKWSEVFCLVNLQTENS